MREWIAVAALAACLLLELAHPVLTRVRVPAQDPDLELIESAAEPASGASTGFRFTSEGEGLPSQPSWLRDAQAGMVPASNAGEAFQPRRAVGLAGPLTFLRSGK